MRAATSATRENMMSHLRSAGIIGLILSMPCCMLAGGGQAQRPAAGSAAAPGAVETQTPNELFVTVGNSLIVDSATPIERVSVGFGDIAEATAVGPTEVLVNGKVPGQTSLIIWQQGNQKLFFDVTVQPSRYGTNTRLEQ